MSAKSQPGGQPGQSVAVDARESYWWLRCLSCDLRFYTPLKHRCPTCGGYLTVDQGGR